MAHEHRQADAAFEPGKHAREQRRIGQRRHHVARFLGRARLLRRRARTHERGELRIAVMCRQRGFDERLAGGAVARADADRAEQAANLRLAIEDRRDAAPEQAQRAEIALPLRAHERAAEFDGRADAPQQALVVVEQRVRIERGHAPPGRQRLGEAEPIRADDFALRFVPDEQMLVVRIEGVEIARATGAFLHLAKAQLAQPADLEQQLRNLRGAGAEHAEVLLRSTSVESKNLLEMKKWRNFDIFDLILNH